MSKTYETPQLVVMKLELGVYGNYSDDSCGGGHHGGGHHGGGGHGWGWGWGWGWWR